MIPLQDSLNSTLVSMVMTSQLTAFSLLFAKGWKPPAGMTPGMILHAMIADSSGNPIVPETEEEARALATLLAQMDLKRIEPGEIEPLIKQAEFLIHQIGTVSSTPVPAQMGGDSQSGEALKQRDTRLLGKINRAQVHLGNSWEDVFGLAHRQATIFATGNKPPGVVGFNTRWKNAEIRNDADIREFAKLMHEWGFVREALRLVSQSSVANYDEADIDRLVLEKQGDDSTALAGAAGQLPGFGGFDF